MNKPCTNCEYAKCFHRAKRDLWVPNDFYACRDCERLKHYKEQLESRRTFCPGRKIENICDLVNALEHDGFVFWREKIYHRGFIESWQLHMILCGLHSGTFRVAIRKERSDL